MWAKVPVWSICYWCSHRRSKELGRHRHCFHINFKHIRSAKCIGQQFKWSLLARLKHRWSVQHLLFRTFGQVQLGGVFIGAVKPKAVLLFPALSCCVRAVIVQCPSIIPAIQLLSIQLFVLHTENYCQVSRCFSQVCSSAVNNSNCLWQQTLCVNGLKILMCTPIPSSKRHGLTGEGKLTH